jgi:hypothetical protein
MSKKKNVYIWCCDYSPLRGEGILALNFAKLLEKNYKEIIHINNYNQTSLFLNHSFFYNYLSPFIGIFKIWMYHIKKEKTAYVNFLPLWNFFIFFLLPKKTILGPITGSVYRNDVYDLFTFIRKYILIIFFKISIKIITKKYNKLIFATVNLKSILPYNLKKISIFNFQFFNMKLHKDLNIKKKRWEIDLLFYNRLHLNKHNKNIFFLLNFLKNKIKIIFIGDKNKNFENLGIVKRKILLNYLRKTKFTVASNENPYSFFTLDAISSGVKIFSFNRNILYFKNSFIKISKKNINNNLLKFFNNSSSRNNFLKKDYYFLKKINKNFQVFAKNNL